MNKISTVIVTGFLFVLLSVQLFAQNNADQKVIVIKPYILPITFYKTTNLVFPYAIKRRQREQGYSCTKSKRG
jgi:hypothetical protein